MGLDITYHAHMQPADAGASGDDYDHFHAYVNPAFPEVADGIVDEQLYRGIESGGFRAGSYGGYNVWRDQLAVLAGYESAKAVWANPEPGPFVELINFSDCEGIIGPRTSAKLAADFAAFQKKADAHEDDWFRSRYAEWRKAFETAADSGCVEFH